MTLKSIAITLVVLSGAVAATEASAASGSGCIDNPVVLNAATIIGYAILAIAVWQFIRAVPYMRFVRKVSASYFFIFPIERTRNLPEFKLMWRHLAVFYGATFGYIIVTVATKGLSC